MNPWDNKSNKLELKKNKINFIKPKIKLIDFEDKNYRELLKIENILENNNEEINFNDNLILDINKINYIKKFMKKNINCEKSCIMFNNNTQAELSCILDLLQHNIPSKLKKYDINKVKKIISKEKPNSNINNILNILIN